jgi:hypothetical protein
MNRKLLAKFLFASTLLVAVALCILLPIQNISAGSSKPTPGSNVSIITKLQSSQITNIEPNQRNGRSLKQAPSSSKVDESPANTASQQTFYAIADATVLEGYPAVNFGDTIDMWAGYDEYLDPYGQIARSLVRFDIAGLPSDQVIAKATLRVYLVNSWDYPDTGRTIQTYRITSNWSEGNVNWSNKPGYGNAYGSNSIVHEAWDWYEFDVTGLVNAWYAGTYSNYGIMLRGPEVSGEDSSWRGFGTRESDYTPQLVIDFTSSESTPTATQTPSSTPTQTPTQTATPTWSGIPEVNGSYLPLVLKYAVSTPTPTATPAVTNTPTPTATNTPVSTAIPGMTFYLCLTEDSSHILSTTGCSLPTDILAGLTEVGFETSLAGDIVGTNYEFALMLATDPEGSSANVDAKIILDHNGQETILSSTSFVVDNYAGSPPYDYKLYTASESGLDPSSVAGDHLILSLTDNGPGNMFISCKSDDSSITIPGINK